MGAAGHGVGSGGGTVPLSRQSFCGARGVHLRARVCVCVGY